VDNAKLYPAKNALHMIKFGEEMPKKIEPVDIQLENVWIKKDSFLFFITFNTLNYIYGRKIYLHQIYICELNLERFPCTFWTD